MRKILVFTLFVCSVLGFSQEIGQNRRIVIRGRPMITAKPLVIIKEKKSDYNELHLLDEKRIEEIIILKPEVAVKLYGSPALAGVIYVKLKKKRKKETQPIVQKPMIIINGIVSDLQSLHLLKEEQIDSISINNIDEILPTACKTGSVIIVKLKKIEK